MIKRIGLLLSIVLILSVILTACAPAATQEPDVVEEPTAEPESHPVVLVDDLGFEIILDAPAQAIISITPSMTEILIGVGAGERLIGRDTNSNYPEAVLEVLDLGGMWDGIPVEDILAMEPDLILMGEIYSADAAAELRELGLNVYWQANPDDFEGLYENIRDIAVLTGTEDQAEELIVTLSARVTAVDEKLADVEKTPLVFYELDASKPAEPWTAGAGSFTSYVISKAKAINLGDSLEGEWVQISSEALVAQDPDVILLSDALWGVTPASVAERAGWEEITAVLEEAVYPFEPLLSVPGPRLVDGYELAAEILHPEAFE